MLGEMVIPHHIGYCEVFNPDDTILVNQPSAKLVEKVVSLIRSLDVKLCQLTSRLPSSAAALPSSAELSLPMSQAPLGFE